MLLLAFSLQGCLPLPVTYWAPTIEKSNSTSIKTDTVSHYSGGLAPNNTVEFLIQEVSIFVKPHRIVLNIPEGRNVRFKSSTVTINHKGSTQPSTIKMSSVDYWDYEKQKSILFKPTSILKGTSRSVLGFPSPISFTIRMRYPSLDSFSLKLPNIIINNKEHSLPLIHFEKSNGFGVFPING